MSKTVEEILAPKPEIPPRIYAYSIADEAHKGLLKVGQTNRDVKQRIAELSRKTRFFVGPMSLCMPLGRSLRGDREIFMDGVEFRVER